jgi:predicted dehydrogenase
MPGAVLAGVMDTDAQKAARVAAEFGTHALPDLRAVAEQADAVSVAAPTKEHARIGCTLLERGLDVLVEKPMAASLQEADQLIAAAERSGRILQVGHLERFNPAIVALEKIVTRPLFFEVHRLGVFSPRSLDIDVVYDVMIHDLDILLALVQAPVTDLRSVGIPVLTDKVDIAHARLEFAGGAVANLTASRVSTERVRKLRFFQAHEYVSVDYTRQDVLRIRVENGESNVEMVKVPNQGQEPLQAELRAFLHAVQTRETPRCDGRAGHAALQLADRVMQGILDHAQRVQLNALAPQTHS